MVDCSSSWSAVRVPVLLALFVCLPVKAESEPVVSDSSKQQSVLLGAEPSPWRAGLRFGILGAGIELSHPIGSRRSVVAQFNYGRLSSEHGFEGDSVYGLTSHLRHYSLHGRHFPWGKGAYAQLGLVYSDHAGRGYWQHPPSSLEGVDAVLSQQAFKYRFSPLALSLGVGWQGAWVSQASVDGSANVQRWVFGFSFDLLIHGSAEVALADWVNKAVDSDVSNALRSGLQADLDDSKVLPNFSVKLLRTF